MNKTTIALLLITLMVLPSIATATRATTTPPHSASHGRYDLLIIAPKPFTNELRPLVRHKNHLGIRTILVTTDTVYKQTFWQGRDDAEHIKYFIKDAVESWGIHYVLLVGGRRNQGHTEHWWLPVRYSHLNRPYVENANLSYPEPKFLSDLYFADLYNQNGSFSSWDDNNNGIFGEWAPNQTAADHPDLIPDVSLGRLPCLNAHELHTVVRKIIDYESHSFENKSWFKTMVVAAGDTYPGRTPYYDGEVYTQQGLDLMTDFTPVKLWTSDKTLKNERDIIRAINRGCGFIWLSGHGNPKTWATHPPNDNNTWITGLRLRSLLLLHNHRKLPVCITGSGCFNSEFNVSLRNSPFVFGIKTPYCLSWDLMIQPHGGSIATIGATAFSYESPDITLGYGGIEWLDRQFFAEYALNHTHILGDCWKDAVTAVHQACPFSWNDTTITGGALVAKNLEQWVLFGDPSLHIGGYP